MGVDFFPCENCGESICDCGSWWGCPQCNKRLCEDCTNSYVKTTYDERDEKTWEDDNCPFCRNELITDSDLLLFILGEFDIDRESAEKRYREANS